MHKLFAAALVAALAFVPLHPRAAADERGAPSWNARAAAAALDQRAEWWTTWSNAQRDRGTFCVSCHTTATYVVARPALRRALGETAPSAAETKIADNVAARVRAWKEVEPFYPDQTRGIPKTSESRGTESILNALTLATRDAPSGVLSDDARRAFDNMWALQMRTGDLAGAWPWLNFHFEPWEAERAAYFGATLAAVAVGIAPGEYASAPPIQDRARALREYLQRGNRTQHVFNRLTLLWASSVWPGLLTRDEQQAIVEAARPLQHDDGGWSVASFADWKRVDGSALDTGSDGYGTGLAALALQSAGVPRTDPGLRRALAWLAAHQDAASGRWSAVSLNKQRDPASDAGKFMGDAATAFAVLALTR